MKDIANKHKEQLLRIKKNVENSYQNFTDNYKRYNDYRNFVFVTTIDEKQMNVLTALKKPVLEFNILEAYVSRLVGEFSKSQPSIKVSASEGVEQNGQTVEVVEGHIRHILQQANKDGLEYNCYRDTLSGGFSAIKVYTQYSGEMSFHQDIMLKRVFDPTLVGFDPLATKPDKSDGDYCFEIIPKRLDDFIKEYPDLEKEKAKVSNNGDNVGPFSWEFKTGKDDIILVADYYEKKRVKKNIVMIANGQVMTTDEYKEFLAEWERSGQIAQPPAIVGKPRTTEITKIVRYKMIESQIFDYEETDFKRLPIIFIDGNSLLMKEGGTGTATQMTRPYIYQAKGAQQLKNMAGQNLANELENMGPPKTVISLEAIPDKYLEQYLNPQDSIVQIYNAYYNGDPNYPLAPPIQPPRPPIPPEVANAFMGADSLVQNVLGSFDGNLAKISTQEVSGIAIQESATLSNAAAMPYIVNYLLGLQSAAQMIVDLLPLYYRTPRTIPVMTAEGKKEYVRINQQGGINLDYDFDALRVNVEAGVSFSVQQTRALQQIIALMNSSPMFAQFINESGLDIVLDNVEIRNIETLRERSEQWMQEQQQMKEKAQKQPNMEQQAIQVAAQQVQAEHEVGMTRVQQQAAAEQAKTLLKLQELELQSKKLEIDLIKIMSDNKMNAAKLGIDQQKADDERMSTLIDANIKESEHKHDVINKHLDRSMKALESAQAHEMKESKADEAMEDIVRGE